MAKRRLLDLAAEGGQQLAQDIRDLLFIHNTDAQKLSRQQAMGGMPNPSIAVTQRDIPFEGFGDISLIGRPERFDPSSRQNPLFSADAYTVRAPSPVRVANKNAYKQFKSDYEPYKRSGNIDDVAYSLGDLESKSRIEPSDFRRVNDFFEYDNAAKLKFAQDNNISVPRKENGDIDYYALSDIKSQNADKYEQWRQEEVSKYFQPEEYFVTNPDYDRYSGRAKLQPYTAENVSKWMSKRSGAGQESTMTFGAGNVRASTTEQIKSLEQARQMKGLLKPADEMAEFKQTSDMMLGDLQDALKDYYQYDTNSFSYFDSVGEMIALSEKKGLKRAMEEVGFKDVPDKLVKEIEGYKSYLRSAPTEYFESKPNRPVGLGEFGGAIVPENTPQGLIDQLIIEGLQIEKYTDEADRVAKRGAFENLMFTRPETVVGAGLLGAGVLGAMAPQEAQAGALTKISDLIKLGYPESVAKRIASGELDMSPQARLARQQEAFPDIVYHGSMQDIVGEYIPKYQDNLMFTTPDPEFASDWAGKGAMQTRVGELDAFDRYRPQKQKLYEEFGSPEYGTPEYDEFSKKSTEIYNQERNAFKTLYPLAVKAKNPFDPTADGMYEKVTEPLFKKKFGVEKLDPSTEEYLRKGAYLFFEDPDVVKELQKMGYDAIKLRESTDGPLNTLAMFDGSKNVRSLLSAAFDPEYTGSNILGSRVIPTTAAGLITAAALAPDQVQSAPSVGLFSAIAADSADPVEARVQQLMEPLRQDPNYTYGDLLPVKRSIDPAERESFPYGFRPAVPGIATGLLEELVRAYEMNRAGRQQEAIQSSLGALL